MHVYVRDYCTIADYYLPFITNIFASLTKVSAKVVNCEKKQLMEVCVEDLLRHFVVDNK